MRMHSCLCFSPDPNFVFSMVELRVTGLVVCRSSEHLKVLQGHLVDQVFARVVDEKSTRFFNQGLKKMVDGGPGHTSAASGSGPVLAPTPAPVVVPSPAPVAVPPAADPTPDPKSPDDKDDGHGAGDIPMQEESSSGGSSDDEES